MPSGTMGRGGSMHDGATTTVERSSVRVQVVKVRVEVAVATTVEGLGVMVKTFVAAARVRVSGFGSVEVVARV